MDFMHEAGSTRRAPIRERLQKLPGAVLLTVGYFASQVPAINDLIRRFD